MTDAGGSNFTLKDIPREQLASLAERGLDEAAVDKAITWANLHYFHSWHAFAKALGECETIVREDVTKLKMAQRMLTQPHVDALKHLRAMSVDYESFVDKHPWDELFDKTDPQHHTCLHDLIQSYDTMHSIMMRHKQRVLKSCGDTWDADIRKLTAQIEDWCPRWEPFRESLLDPEHAHVVSSMCDNPKYAAIGMVCGEPRKYVKRVRLIHADKHGSVVALETLDAGAKMSDHGIETVGYTFVVYTLSRQLPSLTNQVLITRAIEQMRSDVKPSGITLTQQMQRAIEKWERGEILRDAAASSGSGVGVARCEAPQAPPQPASAPEPAGPSVRPSAVPAQAAKRSLAEKLRDAKRPPLATT